MNNVVEILGLSKSELVSFVETIGEPAYRGKQVFAGLHHRRIQSFDEMSDLPKELRTRLKEIAKASSLTIESRYISSDGTRRYLMKTHDQRTFDLQWKELREPGVGVFRSS